MLQRLRQTIGDLLARCNEVTFIALVLTGFIVAGVLCSLSRGSIFSMIGGALVLAAISATRRGTRPYLLWIGMAAVVGIGLVAWVGMTNRLEARLATLIQRQLFADGPLPTGRCDQSGRPLLAGGKRLGTYGFLYESYEPTPADALVLPRRKPVSLSTLVRTGLLGLLLILFILGLTPVPAARRSLVTAGRASISPSRSRSYSPWPDKCCIPLATSTSSCPPSGTFCPALRDGDRRSVDYRQPRTRPIPPGPSPHRGSRWLWPVSHCWPCRWATGNRGVTRQLSRCCRSRALPNARCRHHPATGRGDRPL